MAMSIRVLLSVLWQNNEHFPLFSFLSVISDHDVTLLWRIVSLKFNDIQIRIKAFRLAW